MKRDPPKCRNCNKLLKWLPWTGKPQPPVDPKTNKPCDCWRFERSDKQRFLTKDSFLKCPYCESYYQKDKGNEEHERLYHSDKIKHNGIWRMEKQQFE